MKKEVVKNENYENLEHKEAFCSMVAFKLELKPNTLRNYLETDRVPPKHKARIEKALIIQLELDQKIKSIHKKAFEKI